MKSCAEPVVQERRPTFVYHVGRIYSQRESNQYVCHRYLPLRDYPYLREVVVNGIVLDKKVFSSQKVDLKILQNPEGLLPLDIHLLTSSWGNSVCPFYLKLCKANLRMERFHTGVKLLMPYFHFLKSFLIKLCLFSPWGRANGQLSSRALLLPLPAQQKASETVIIQWWNTKCRNAISPKVSWDFVMPF